MPAQSSRERAPLRSLSPVFDGRDGGVTGMRARWTRQRLMATLVVSWSLACTMPPGGGVSGTVVDASGKPMAGVELTLTWTPRIFGIPVPFADPARVPTTTNDVGYFRVVWPHGDRHEGPLLEIGIRGYAPVAERVPIGTAECGVVLVAAGATDKRSKANCRQVR